MKKRVCMKKGISLLLTIAMVFSAAACGGSKDQTGSSDHGAGGTEESRVEIADALTLLTTVWNSYGEDEKFPAAGGDFSEENSVMDGPGRYGIEDAASLDTMLGLPADAASKIDGAASLMHMMNANTFTCGAFHVSDQGDLPAVTALLKENILKRQWMCGFPDKLVIFTIGSYAVSAFGNEEIINTFKDKVTAAYETAVLVYEEAIE